MNADAASQEMGISYLTSSIYARQGRAESHFLRISIISDILDENLKEDITQDMRAYWKQ